MSTVFANHVSENHTFDPKAFVIRYVPKYGRGIVITAAAEYAGTDINYLRRGCHVCWEAGKNIELFQTRSVRYYVIDLDIVPKALNKKE